MKAALVLALVGTLCAFTGWKLMVASALSSDGEPMFWACLAYVGAVLVLIAAFGAANT
jgi:hypothetical protein